MANPRIDELRKRLEKEPGSRLFAQLAEELRKDGDLEEAISVCREGLQKQPNYPSARMTLGRALFDSGDLSAARAELESVVKGAADNILAGRLLGECLERQGDRAGALARFKATLALAPGDRQILDRIQALELSMPAAAAGATMVMPPPGSLRQPPVSFEATLIDVPAPLEAEEPSAGVEPAPIPLASMDGEVFELERSYQGEPTLVGTAEEVGVFGKAASAGAVPAAAGEAPIPSSVSDEGFELERPYETPPTSVRAAAPTGAGTTHAPATLDPESFLELETPAPPVMPGPSLTQGAADAELNTATLAELYLSQGVMDKAIVVYRQVLERDPHNERARTRLSEIEALDRRIRAEELAAGGGAVDPQTARRQAIERTIASLEGLLSALRRG